jgi:hypothetical protein
VIEKPRYGLSWSRISFGRLQLKAYTKGEHALRFEATVHNAKELRCRRSLDNFAEIITLLAVTSDRSFDPTAPKLSRSGRPCNSTAGSTGRYRPVLPVGLAAFNGGKRAGRCAGPCAGLLCVLRTSHSSWF